MPEPIRKELCAKPKRLGRASIHLTGKQILLALFKGLTGLSLPALLRLVCLGLSWPLPGQIQAAGIRTQRTRRLWV